MKLSKAVFQHPVQINAVSYTYITADQNCEIWIDGIWLYIKRNSQLTLTHVSNVMTAILIEESKKIETDKPHESKNTSVNSSKKPKA